MAIQDAFNPIIFIFAATIAFFVPGDLLVGRLKLDTLPRITSAFALGISLWALQGFIFGLLNIRFLTYFYLIGFALAWFALNKNKQINLGDINLDKPFLLLIILGGIGQLSAVWFIGRRITQGIEFCCRGVPDAIYHLALTRNLVESVPPEEPGMVGTIVHNYHYLPNLVIADLIRIFHLPLFSTEFQYMSLLLVLLTGFSILSITQLLNLQIVYARLLALFIYFNGSILFLLTLLRGKGLNFNLEILDDASKMLAGPPRAFSITLFLASLILFTIWTKSKKVYPGILLGLIIGSLVGFKVYTGFFVMFGMTALSAYFLLKKELRMFIPVIITFAVAAVFYIPVNKLAGGLQLSGFWRIENFILTDGLAISKLEFLRLNFLNQRNYLLVLLLEILFLLIYLIFQFGTTALAFIQSKKSLSLFPLELNIFLISGLIVSLIIGLFFTQNPGGANTIQFVISFFVIASIYAALSIYYWLPKLSVTTSVVVIILTLLTSAFSLHEIFFNFSYIKNNQGYIVTNSELQLLQDVSLEKSGGIILLDENKSQEENMLYLTFLSSKKLYLAGTGVLKDHGVNIKKRQNIVKTIFSATKSQDMDNILKQNKINYIYLTSQYNQTFNQYKSVYKYNGSEILKVD